MAKFTIERTMVDGKPVEPSARRYFRHIEGTVSVETTVHPWVIEGSCFYDAVKNMWQNRLSESGALPTMLRFQPNHPENSETVRMWMWSSRELIKVTKIHY